MIYIFLYILGMVLTFIANAYRVSKQPYHYRETGISDIFLIVLWPFGITTFLIVCFCAVICDIHDLLIDFFVTKQKAKAKIKSEPTDDV